MTASSKKSAVRRVRRSLLTAVASAKAGGESGKQKAVGHGETDGDC